MTRIRESVKQLAATTGQILVFSGKQFLLILCAYPIISVVEHSLEFYSIKLSINAHHSVKTVTKQSQTTRLLSSTPKFGVESLLKGVRITTLALADLNKQWIPKGDLEKDLKSQLAFRISSVKNLTLGLQHIFDCIYGPLYVTTIATDQSMNATFEQLRREGIYLKGFFMTLLGSGVEYFVQRLLPVAGGLTQWGKIGRSLVPKVIVYPFIVAKRASQLSVSMPQEIGSRDSLLNRIHKEIRNEIKSLQDLVEQFAKSPEYRKRIVKSLLLHLGSSLCTTWFMLILERRLANFLREDPNRVQLVNTFLTQICWILFGTNTLAKTVVKVGINTLQKGQRDKS